MHNASCPFCEFCGQVILYGIEFFGETPLHEKCFEKTQEEIHSGDFSMNK